MNPRYSIKNPILLSYLPLLSPEITIIPIKSPLNQKFMVSFWEKNKKCPPHWHLGHPGLALGRSAFLVAVSRGSRGSLFNPTFDPGVATWKRARGNLRYPQNRLPMVYPHVDYVDMKMPKLGGSISNFQTRFHGISWGMETRIKNVDETKQNGKISWCHRIW